MDEFEKLKSNYDSGAYAKEAFKILCSWDDSPSEENKLKIDAFVEKTLGKYAELNKASKITNLTDILIVYLIRNKRSETASILNLDKTNLN